MTRRLIRRMLHGTALAGLAIAFGTPFLLMGLGAFMTSEQLMQSPPSPWPNPWAPENFRHAWEAAALGRFMLNSMLVATTTAVGQVLTGAMAGYAFARLPFRGSDRLFVTVMALWSIPAPVLVVPLFALICGLGWFDSPWALIMPGLVSATALLTFRQTFRDFPTELADAAFLDGCSPWQTFWKIALPTARPAIATVGLLAFMASWNAFFWPLLVTQGDTWRTLPVGLAAYRSAFREVTDWGALLAATAIATMPVVAIFLFAQKHLLSDLMDGSLRD